MTGVNFSSWFNLEQGCLFADGFNNNTRSAGNLVIAEIGDGTVSNLIELYQVNTGAGVAFVAASGTTQATITVAGALPIGANGKLAASYKFNDFSAAGNGVLGTPDTSGIVPTNLNALYIGRFGGGSSHWNGYIKRLTYYPQALTAANLQAVTR
jgi:hypothetical protein